jgi:hypothetical protein
LREEVFKGMVISIKNKAFTALQVVTELLRGPDNAKKLLFMDWVVLFSGVELARRIAYGAGTITLVLEEDST